MADDESEHRHLCPECLKEHKCWLRCSTETLPECDGGYRVGGIALCDKCEADAETAAALAAGDVDHEAVEGQPMYGIEVNRELIAVAPDADTALRIAERLGYGREQVLYIRAGEAVSRMTASGHAPTEWAKRAARESEQAAGAAKVESPDARAARLDENAACAQIAERYEMDELAYKIRARVDK